MEKKKSKRRKIVRKKSNSVRILLDNFKSNLFSISTYFHKFGEIAASEDNTALKKDSEYFDRCMEDAGINISDDKKREDSISLEQVQTFANLLIKRPKISAKNYEILSRSSFLMLNNYFEYLLTDLLTYFYNKFQESLNDKKFYLTLKELNEYENINDATKDLILKEVESMVIELTFPNLLDHFKDELYIQLEESIIDWEKIEEYRERRHLIVHNSSLVNKKYLVRTNNRLRLKLGDKVNIEQEYFNEAYEEFFLAGIILSYNCWGKWDKETVTEAIKDMLDESFEKLKQERYDFVIRLAQFIDNIDARTEDQENILLRSKFNKCIALKKLNKKSELDKELKKIKVGTSSPIFQLGHQMLSGNFKNVIDLIEKSVALEEVNLEKYLEWPLFSFARENESLNAKVLKVFDSV